MSFVDLLEKNVDEELEKEIGQISKEKQCSYFEALAILIKRKTVCFISNIK